MSTSASPGSMVHFAFLLQVVAKHVDELLLVGTVCQKIHFLHGEFHILSECDSYLSLSFGSSSESSGIGHINGHCTGW